MSKRESFYLPGRELRVQTDATGSRSITGQIPYNSLSAGLPWAETISPGAFADALKPGADVLMLRDHDPSLLLGRTISGTLQLRDASGGLEFTCQLPNTSTANDLAESLTRRDITGVSFGFVCTSDQWKDDGKGQLTRTLLAVALHEISVCSFAAYPDASASLRSVPKQLRSLIKLTKRTNSEGCDCPCFECDENDDCSECENDDCDFDCPDCPNQDDGDRSTRLTWSERTLLRLEVLSRL